MVAVLGCLFIAIKRATDCVHLAPREAHLKALLIDLPHHVGDEVFGSLEVWGINASRAIQDDGDLSAWAKTGNRSGVGMELGQE